MDRPQHPCTTVDSRDVQFNFSGERFPIDIIGSYDVDRAKSILSSSPRRSQPVPVAEWRALAKYMEWHMPDVHADESIDSALPVIVATVDERRRQYMLIDGWHRLEKASASGQEFVPGFFLTQKESVEIFDLAWCGLPLAGQ